MKKINFLIAFVFIFSLFAMNVAFPEQGYAQAQQRNIRIAGLKDKTLTKMRGKSLSAKDGTTPVTQTAEGYRLSFHSWNCTAGDKAIAFEEEIDQAALDEYSGLSIRMFVHLSAQSPYYLKGGDYGIFFYGYGSEITGAETDAYVELPQDIQQDKWIDFKITADSAKKLADSDGKLKGLQYGAHIECSAGNGQYFYIGEPKHNKTYILIESISLYEELSEPLQKDIYVAAAGAGEEPVRQHDAWNGVLQQVNGIKKGNAGWEEFHERPIRVYEDSEAVNGRSYAFNFHSWYPTVSDNVLPFSRAVDMSESKGGLLIRIKVHLSPRSPYYTSLGGIRFLALGATGAEGEGYMIPGSITQDTWITLHLSPAEAARLANDDGKIYGLQIGSVLHVGTNDMNSLYIGESASYIKIDYIATCSERTLTYHNYDGAGNEQSVPVITGLNTENYYYTPAKKEGMLFCGWYEGENITEFTTPFDFSEQVFQDVHLTARWIELCEDLSQYYGVYEKDGKRIELTEIGLNIRENEFNYEWSGIGKDGVLYLVSAYRVEEIDLSQYAKKNYFTATFYCFGSVVDRIIVAEGEPCEASSYQPSGYQIKKWSLSSDATESSPAFSFGQTLNENISLYAYCERAEENTQAYEDVYGLYYNVNDKSLLELGKYHSTRFRDADDTETSAVYYLLKDGSILISDGSGEKRGSVSGQRLNIGEQEFIKLSAYHVRFESDGNDVAQTIVNGNDYKVTPPAAPVREGLVFQGWFTERQGGERFDFEDVIYRNMTIYAQWIPDTGIAEKSTGSQNGCGKNDAQSTATMLMPLTVLSVLLRRKR